MTIFGQLFIFLLFLILGIGAAIFGNWGYCLFFIVIAAVANINAVRMIKRLDRNRD